MIKAILIDDEPLARSIIKEYLKDYPEITIVAECNDGFEGIKAIAEYSPDLLFLDIQMPKINGFEMLELLDEPPAVIFTTAYDEYALKAFEANATDYLLKPFSRERFNKAIQKWLENRKNNATDPSVQQVLESASLPLAERQRVVVKSGAKIHIIPIHDIQYMEAYDDYVKIHTKDGVYLKSKTMGFYEKNLEPLQFVRVHRSYIVKVEEINKIEPMEKESHVAILRSGTKIPVSKAGYARLKEVLGI